MDGTGSILVTGSYSGDSVAFGTTTLPRSANSDVFVAKLTPAGAWSWVTHVGGAGRDFPNDIAVDRRHGRHPAPNERG